jgi:hypothetical protein
MLRSMLRVALAVLLLLGVGVLLVYGVFVVAWVPSGSASSSAILLAGFGPAAALGSVLVLGVVRPPWRLALGPLVALPLVVIAPASGDSLVWVAVAWTLGGGAIGAILANRLLRGPSAPERSPP